MKITATAKDVTVVILDDHGNVAFDYKVSEYNCTMDLPALVNATAALIHHIANHTALIQKL